MLALQRSRSSSTEATPLLGDSPSPRIEHNVSTEDPEAAQDGVKQAEAITMVWSKKSLVAAYILCVFSPAKCAWKFMRLRHNY